MTRARWFRLGILLASVGLLARVDAAPPTEYVARAVSWYTCSQVGGTTNASSSGSGADFVHSLSCTIDANMIRPATVIRACAHVTVSTGTAAPTLMFKLRAGATTIHSPLSAFNPENSITKSTAFCMITVGGAAPGPAAATYTAKEGAVTDFYFTEEANSIAQPVNLATNGALVWTFVSRWNSPGTGVSSAILNSFTVSITN